MEEDHLDVSAKRKHVCPWRERLRIPVYFLPVYHDRAKTGFHQSVLKLRRNHNACTCTLELTCNDITQCRGPANKVHRLNFRQREAVDGCGIGSRDSYCKYKSGNLKASKNNIKEREEEKMEGCREGFCYLATIFVPNLSTHHLNKSLF